MSRIILIKHSLPEISKDQPAASWHLSAEGLRRCEALAQALSGFQVNELISSSEPKAVETARETAGLKGIGQRVVEGLHEHERAGMPYFEKHTDFEQAVQQFFDKPDRVVLGEESADQAYTRFSNAVKNMVRLHKVGDLAIVSHGTVISLFVSRKNKIQPFPLWQSLGLPSMLVLNLPDYRLVESIPRIGI